MAKKMMVKKGSMKGGEKVSVQPKMKEEKMPMMMGKKK